MENIVFQTQRKRKKKRILAGMILLFLFLLSSILVYLYPFDSRKAEAYFHGENPILFNGKQAGNGLIAGDMAYVPLAFMQDYIDDSILFDKKSDSIIIITENHVVQFPTNSLTYYVNQVPVQLGAPPLILENGERYLALDPVLSYYGIDYMLLHETGAIKIIENGMKLTIGTINGHDVDEKRLRLRTKPDLQSPYTAQTVDNEKVTIENELDKYYYIRKENGIAGYLEKKYVHKEKTETIFIEKEQKTANLPPLNGPLHLTWEAVYGKNPELSTIPEMPGVNIVSPTWFELTDNNSLVRSFGSIDYIHWAKAKGYQVWALFSNGFNPDLTHEAFKDFETRQKIIMQLLHYSEQFQLDGINIDIENVRKEDGPLVTQCVREATPYFHRAGLYVSMDITFIADGNWSAFYERDKLAQIADYLIVMAYDEHWGTSPKAGSVASFPWVEQNLQKLLEFIPNDKLILGVPLYTRLWEIKNSGEVSSKAIKMAEAKKWLNDRGITPVYDETSGQNFAEYYDADAEATYQIWLEDELSLKKRAQLAAKYQLKGIASWSRHFADETAWLALSLDNHQVAQN